MPLITPDLMLKNVFELTPELLGKLGIRALILDVDNTLRFYRTKNPVDGIAEWAESLKKAGIALVILSNNFSSRVEPFAKKLGIDFIAMGLKPAPMGLLRAKKRLGVTKRQVAIVGDQIFTDIIGGNLLGITTILVEPFAREPGITYVLKRNIEKPIIRRYRSKKRKQEE